MIWWRDKGVKDKVKQARRAKRDMVGMVDDSLDNVVDDMVDIVDMMVVDIEDDMVDMVDNK